MPISHTLRLSCTGVALLGDGCIVTSSTDQRVTLWRAAEAQSESESNGTGGSGNAMQRIDSLVSEVADVTALDTISLLDGRQIVAVCGIGLEMFEVLSDVV